MTENSPTLRLVTLLSILMVFGVQHVFGQHTGHDATNKPVNSPYVGQETRAIKALSESDIQGLLSGSGTPFNGMAKPAELNGYPGPRHVIDAYESGKLDLTDIQFEKIQAQFLEMQNLAIPLGEKLVAVELEIEEAFQNKTITQELLQSHIAESAGLYAQLRVLHMSYHLKMIDILSPDQISQYNILRGYSIETNPCENVPEGHDPQMWKLHNNCN